MFKFRNANNLADFLKGPRYIPGNLRISLIMSFTSRIKFLLLVPIMSYSTSKFIFSMKLVQKRML